MRPGYAAALALLAFVVLFACGSLLTDPPSNQPVALGRADPAAPALSSFGTVAEVPDLARERTRQARKAAPPPPQPRKRTVVTPSVTRTPARPAPVATPVATRAPQPVRTPAPQPVRTPAASPPVATPAPTVAPKPSPAPAKSFDDGGQPNGGIFDDSGSGP